MIDNFYGQQILPSTFVVSITNLSTGYLGDSEANASSFDPEGWLKTGDLCYFDNEGFLHVVDRLKELIKYKAYQVYFRSICCNQVKSSLQPYDLFICFD